MRINCKSAQHQQSEAARGSPKRTALIIGVSGQDGSYLAKLLIDKGYKVLGSSRDHEINDFKNLIRLNIKDRLELVSIDTSDFRSLATVLAKHSPDEIYNLSGQTSVGMSFQYPVETFNSILIGTMNLLECVRVLGLKSRIYNAGSGEVFGSQAGPANETTPHKPLSPYATAKSAAANSVSNYRDAYGIFACTGYLFNHESPLRPARFVTQKIVKFAENVSSGPNEKLTLGNITISRDWGWAPDYVEAMCLMMNSPEPRDFVVATGVKHSLQEFLALVFDHHGLQWSDHVVSEKHLERPLDIESSFGDPSMIGANLGWCPTVDFPTMVKKLIAGQLY